MAGLANASCLTGAYALVTAVVFSDYTVLFLGEIGESTLQLEYVTCIFQGTLLVQTTSSASLEIYFCFNLQWQLSCQLRNLHHRPCQLEENLNATSSCSLQIQASWQRLSDVVVHLMSVLFVNAIILRSVLTEHIPHASREVCTDHDLLLMN